MKAIITYNNTKHALEIEKANLDVLLDRKQQLHSKYFKITSSVSEARGNGNFNDKMTLYMAELMKVDKSTGKSLNDEIHDSKEEITRLRKHLDIMTDNLLQMHGIEYELYSQIVVKGLRISRAVEKTAEIYQCGDSTIWRVYNKKIKKVLK